MGLPDLVWGQWFILPVNELRFILYCGGLSLCSAGASLLGDHPSPGGCQGKVPRGWGGGTGSLWIPVKDPYSINSPTPSRPFQPPLPPSPGARVELRRGCGLPGGRDGSRGGSLGGGAVQADPVRWVSELRVPELRVPG